ncbi:MAG: DUF6314 family protein [Bacteroidales bacterium]
MMEKPLNKLKSSILKVQKINFTIESNPEYGPELANGSGTVKVISTIPEKVIFDERGSVELAPELISVFQNTMFWDFTKSEEYIVLGHLRQGENHPVELVHLVFKTDNLLISADPHYCGDDIYYAEVELKQEEIQVIWKVKGPKKDYIKKISYFN